MHPITQTELHTSICGHGVAAGRGTSEGTIYTTWICDASFADISSNR